MDKQFLESQTIRGALQLVFIIMGLVGIQITDSEKESITVAVIQLGASIWAIWSFVQVVRGRLQAKRDLRLGSRKL